LACAGYNFAYDRKSLTMKKPIKKIVLLGDGGDFEQRNVLQSYLQSPTKSPKVSHLPVKNYISALINKLERAECKN
jgi:hypothetical protein